MVKTIIIFLIGCAGMIISFAIALTKQKASERFDICFYSYMLGILVSCISILIN